MKLRILFNWFVPPLNSLERKLLSALGDHLTPEAQLLLSKQLDQINYVQRHAKNKEVNLYCMRKGKPTFDEDLIFPADQKEIKIASLLFISKGISEMIRADFWMVNGYIFSVKFNHSPKGMSNNIEIRDVKILIDPMMPIRRGPRAPLEANILKGGLSEWSKKWRLTKLREPLSALERDYILQELDAQFPDDYLELISQTEGAEINGCVIFGLSELRDFITPEANYYILSELAGQGAVVILQGKSDKMIYFFEYENERPIRSGTSFFAVIDKLLLRS